MHKNNRGMRRNRAREIFRCNAVGGHAKVSNSASLPSSYTEAKPDLTLTPGTPASVRSVFLRSSAKPSPAEQNDEEFTAQTGVNSQRYARNADASFERTGQKPMQHLQLPLHLQEFLLSLNLVP